MACSIAGDLAMGLTRVRRIGVCSRTSNARMFRVRGEMHNYKV